MKREFIDDKTAMEQFLREEFWGSLALSVDGQPYVVPLNYAYVDGKILFHCGLKGRKIDAMRANPRVCFAVGRQEGPPQPHPGGKPCHLDNQSVLCFGRARIVEGDDEKKALLNAFNRAFRPEAPDLKIDSLKGCHCVEITIEEMTGRREKGGKPTFWRYAPK